MQDWFNIQTWIRSQDWIRTEKSHLRKKCYPGEIGVIRTTDNALQKVDEKWIKVVGCSKILKQTIRNSWKRFKRSDKC